MSYRHDSFSTSSSLLLPLPGLTPSPSDDLPPSTLPTYLYRVHRSSAQTKYDFSKGFVSKNRTTILNHVSALHAAARAHLTQQTNRSSPFISLYDSEAHAEHMAARFAARYAEDTWVVQVDTRHLARGPVFRAADLLKEDEVEAWKEVHRGEYLVQYTVPPQAIVRQTLVGRTNGASKVGVIGSGVWGGQGLY